MQFLWELYDKILVGKTEKRLMNQPSEEIKKKALAKVAERKQAAKPEMLHVLITVRNNVVHNAVVAADSDELEEMFKKEVSTYGVEATDVDLEEGYIELEDATICMTHAFPPDKDKRIQPQPNQFYWIEFKPTDAPDYSHYVGPAKFLERPTTTYRDGIYKINDGSHATFYDSDIAWELPDMTEQIFEEMVRENRQKEIAQFEAKFDNKPACD
jgi:hypothetical protein